jgi:hypothetical protein
LLGGSKEPLLRFIKVLNDPELLVEVIDATIPIDGLRIGFCLGFA